MKEFRFTGWQKIILYLGLTMVLGALLAPWLFHFGKETVRQGWLANGPAPLTYLHGALDRSPFSRYFNRAVMLVALIGLFFLIPALNFRGWRDLKIFKNPCAFMDATAGVLLAAGFLLFMGAGFLYMGFFVPEADADWGVIPKLILTAVAVGIIEEIFFRGAILGVCLRRMKAFGAVILTSGLFALIHFIKPKLKIPDDQVTWTTGLDALGVALRQFQDLPAVTAQFLTLFALGVVLAITRLRTHSLWLPIGLHAGWVLGYELFKKNTDASPLVAQWAPWVGSDLKIGIIPLIIIAITGALASLWIDLSRRPVYDAPSSQDQEA